MKEERKLTQWANLTLIQTRLNCKIGNPSSVQLTSELA